MEEDHLQQLAQKHTLEALQSLVEAMRSDSRTAQKQAARFLQDRMDLVKRFMPEDAATIEQDINRILSGK